MLKKILNIKNGDILSIVGSGGKTTTMFTLGRELINSKTLLTTSTKIGRQVGIDYETIDKFEDLKNMYIKSGIYLSGNSVENNKFTGIDNMDLEMISYLFDYIIIEADGAKMMPLKGWREIEPVILNGSNKTLGIIPIDIYNMKLKDINIFNRDIFMDIVGNEKVYFDKECIYSLTTYEKGLFKNSIGDKTLFLNRCDELNEEIILEFDDLAIRLKKEKNINTILGSAKMEKYHVY